jgi:hypothetical protein
VGEDSAPSGRTLDGRVAEQLRRRDPEGLGALFDLFGPNVYALLSPVEADAATLDGMVEDVFWDAWVAAGRSGGDGDVRRTLLQAVSARVRGRTAPPRATGE